MTLPISISIMQFDKAFNAGQITAIDLLSIAQRLGAQGAEFRDSYLRAPKTEVPAIRQAARDAGLKVSYATTATLFTADEAQAEKTRNDIKTAAGLGSPFLRVFQGVFPGSESDPSWDRARALLEAAADAGIKLALENFRIPPGNQLAEIKRTLDAFPTETLGTNVDIGNYGANDQSGAEAIRTLGPRIIASHLSDKKGAGSTYLGDGELPFKEIFATFAELPQPVLHCLEFDGGENPEAVITASFDFVRDWV
jgi:sugar phosphate isomerase/epimerase